jgi:hypothetical protein
MCPCLEKTHLLRFSENGGQQELVLPRLTVPSSGSGSTGWLVPPLWARIARLIFRLCILGSRILLGGQLLGRRLKEATGAIMLEGQGRRAAMVTVGGSWRGRGGSEPDSWSESPAEAEGGGASFPGRAAGGGYNSGARERPSKIRHDFPLLFFWIQSAGWKFKYESVEVCFVNTMIYCK